MPLEDSQRWRGETAEASVGKIPLDGGMSPRRDECHSVLTGLLMHSAFRSPTETESARTCSNDLGSSSNSQPPLRDISSSQSHAVHLTVIPLGLLSSSDHPRYSVFSESESRGTSITLVPNAHTKYTQLHICQPSVSAKRLCREGSNLPLPFLSHPFL